MYLSYIKQALRGAKYHEDLAFLFSHPNKKEYDKVVFHLRAYYWELFSIWHYVLQEANIQTINLNPNEVRGRFLERLQNKVPNYKFLALLLSIHDDICMKRIRAMRDHSHKWELNPYQVEINQDNTNVICIDNLSGKDLGLEKQVNVDRNDLWFLKASIEKLYKVGFFEKSSSKS